MINLQWQSSIQWEIMAWPARTHIQTNWLIIYCNYFLAKLNPKGVNNMNGKSMRMRKGERVYPYLLVPLKFKIESLCAYFGITLAWVKSCAFISVTFNTENILEFWENVRRSALTDTHTHTYGQNATLSTEQIYQIHLNEVFAACLLTVRENFYWTRASIAIIDIVVFYSY